MSDIIKYKDINIRNIIFTELKESDRLPSQKFAYIQQSLDGKNIPYKIQSCKKVTNYGGIPKEGPYYADAKSRAFFKYCFDGMENDPQLQLFHDKLLEIDQVCNTDEFRKKIFGEKNHNQYAYQPIIRIPEVDEDEPRLDKNGKPYYQPRFTKIKLELEYEEDTDNPKNIPKFTVFEKVDNNRVKIELNSFDDVAKFIVWKSEVRFIISFSKLYAMKTKSGTEKKKYGIILKATCIEVERPANVNNNQKSNDAFVDSDDEEDNNKKETKITRKTSLFNEPDEDEDEDNNLNINNKKNISNTKNNLDIEDEDEDDEEVIKQAAAAVAEEDEEEVIEKPVKGKSKTTKSKK